MTKRSKYPLAQWRKELTIEAQSVPELAEKLGYSVDSKERSSLSDFCRREVKRGIFVQSVEKIKHNARFYGTTHEKIREKILRVSIPHNFKRMVAHLEDIKIPRLKVDLMKDFKLMNTKWHMNKHINYFINNGILIEGKLDGHIGKKGYKKDGYKYLRHANSIITEEHKEKLSQLADKRTKQRAIDGNKFERDIAELVSRTGIQPTKREVEIRRHYENDYGETFEYDIIEKLWYGDIYVMNVYDVKKHTVTAIHLYKFDDKLKTFYGKVQLGRKWLVCTDASKSAWDVAKRLGITIMTAYRLRSLFPDEDFLKEVTKGVQQVRRLSRHAEKTTWTENRTLDETQDLPVEVADQHK